MASYLQFQGRVRKRKLPKVVWLCGPDRALVEDCIDAMRSLISPSRSLKVSPDAVELWEALTEKGLLIARNVDVVENWEYGWTWVESCSSAPLTVAFVSDQPIYDKNRRVQATIAQSRHGLLVRCVSLDRAALHRWLEAELPMEREVADEAIDWCDGSVRRLRDLVWRVRLLGVEPSVDAVRQLIPLLSTEQFARQLLRGNKQVALSVVETMGAEECSAVVSLLDRRVDLMQQVRSAILENRVSELAKTVRPTGLWDTQLTWSALDYDPPRCASIRSLLAMVSGQLQQGRGREALAAAVALW